MPFPHSFSFYSSIYHFNTSSASETVEAWNLGLAVLFQLCYSTNVGLDRLLCLLQFHFGRKYYASPLRLY